MGGDGVDDLAVGVTLYSGNEFDVFVVEDIPVGTTPITDVATVRVTLELGVDDQPMSWPEPGLAGGDLDGDGLADLAHGRTWADDGAGQVSVFTRLTPGDVGPADAATTFTGAGVTGLGLASLADIDGDGLAELAFGSADANGRVAWVFSGAAPGVIDVAAADITLTAGGSDVRPATFASADVDDDGRQDLCVGDSGSHRGARGAGASFVFLTPPAGAASLDDADVILLGSNGHGSSGWILENLGDPHGLGYDTLLAGGRPNEFPWNWLYAEPRLTGGTRWLGDGDTVAYLCSPDVQSFRGAEPCRGRHPGCRVAG